MQLTSEEAPAETGPLHLVGLPWSCGVLQGSERVSLPKQHALSPLWSLSGRLAFPESSSTLPIRVFGAFELTGGSSRSSLPPLAFHRRCPHELRLSFGDTRLPRGPIARPPLMGFGPGFHPSTGAFPCVLSRSTPLESRCSVHLASLGFPSATRRQAHHTFRSRGSSPPQRLTPHRLRRFVAPCSQSWGSSRSDVLTSGHESFRSRISATPDPSERSPPQQLPSRHREYMPSCRCAVPLTGPRSVNPRSLPASAAAASKAPPSAPVLAHARFRLFPFHFRPISHSAHEVTHEVAHATPMQFRWGQQAFSRSARSPYSAPSSVPSTPGMSRLLPGPAVRFVPLPRSPFPGRAWPVQPFRRSTSRL